MQKFKFKVKRDQFDEKGALTRHFVGDFILVTEVRDADGAPLKLKDGDTVELTEAQLNRLYNHDTGPVLPRGLLVPMGPANDTPSTPKDPAPTKPKAEKNSDQPAAQ